MNWLFNITINDISVIYLTAHRCAGGLRKKLYQQLSSQHHRHFVVFFKAPVQAQTRDQPFYTVFRETIPFGCLLPHAGNKEDTFSDLTPGSSGWCYTKKVYFFNFLPTKVPLVMVLKKFDMNQRFSDNKVLHTKILKVTPRSKAWYFRLLCEKGMWILH